MMWEMSKVTRMLMNQVLVMSQPCSASIKDLAVDGMGWGEKEEKMRWKIC